MANFMTDGYSDYFEKTDPKKVEHFLLERVKKNKLRVQTIASIIKTKLDKSLNGLTILEFGCSTGYASREFALMGNQCAGVDVSQEVIDIARKDHQNIAKLSFVKISDALPFPDKSFDIVFSSEVIEHVPIDQRRQYFKEFRRVMKDNGAGYISFPNFWFPLEPHYLIPFHHWVQRLWPREGLEYEDIPSKYGIRKALQEYFEVLDVTREFLESDYVSSYYSRSKVLLAKWLSRTPMSIQDYLLLTPRR